MTSSGDGMRRAGDRASPSELATAGRRASSKGASEPGSSDLEVAGSQCRSSGRGDGEDPDDTARLHPRRPEPAGAAPCPLESPGDLRPGRRERRGEEHPAAGAEDPALRPGRGGAREGDRCRARWNPWPPVLGGIGGRVDRGPHGSGGSFLAHRARRTARRGAWLLWLRRGAQPRPARGTTTAPRTPVCAGERPCATF
jgi:hypothetical protein